MAPAYIRSVPSTAELNEMTLPEKLDLMEALWADLCRQEEQVPVEDWHKEVLDTRARLLAEGRASFADWEIAKARITKRTA